ncbi:MAG: hypothetical protein GVX78_03400, partial [Bacteroidetes bacterium]|nr:hypothetical protein [Bacteroidota bacterium]
EKDKQKIISWIDGGMESSGQDTLLLDPMRASSKAQQVFCMDTAFEQYSVYMPQFQVFVIPIDFDRGTFAQNIRFHPGNPSIVRSCRVSVSTDEKWHKLDEWDPRYGYYSFGGPGAFPEYENWYEWQPFNIDEADRNRQRYLPPHSYLILEIHYGPTGKKQWDQSCLSFDTTHHPIPLQVHSAPLVSRLSASGAPGQLPAHEKTRIHSSLTLPFDISLTALSPRGHLLCRSWEVYAKTPEGDIRKLLKISDWEKMWREKYFLEQPVLLKAGTEIRALATYDNTAENPYQPADPPIDMSWSHGMYDEQFKVTFDYIKTRATTTATLFSPSTLVRDQPLRLSIFSKKTLESQLSIRNINRDEEVAHQLISLPGKGEHIETLENIHLSPGIYELHLRDVSGRVLDTSLLFVFEEVDFFKR